MEKSGEEVVNASIKNVTAENGKITVALDKNPTVTPVNETLRGNIRWMEKKKHR